MQTACSPLKIDIFVKKTTIDLLLSKNSCERKKIADVMKQVTGYNGSRDLTKENDLDKKILATSLIKPLVLFSFLVRNVASTSRVDFIHHVIDFFTCDRV